MTFNRKLILEKVLLVYLSHYFPYIISLCVTNTLGLYIFAGYSKIFLIITLILLKTFKKNNKISVSLNEILLLTLLAIIISIESYHIYSFTGIDEMADIRAILYSPFHTSIIVCLLMYLFLKNYSKKNLINILNFLIKYNTLCIITHCLLTIIFTIGVVNIGNEYLYFINNNFLSYTSAFVVYLLVCKKQILNNSIKKKYYNIFLLLNIIIIILQTTRGALIVIVIILFINLVKKLKITYISSAFACLLIIIPILFYDKWIILYQMILGDNFEKLFMNVYNSVMTHQDISWVGYDDQTISSVSRIMADIIGLRRFFENPIIGIGLYNTYNIKVSNTGIHSFIGISTVSSGLIGIISLLIMFKILSQNYLNIFRKDGLLIKRFSYIVLTFGVILFNNALPWWFFALFISCNNELNNNRCLDKKIKPPFCDTSDEIDQSKTKNLF